MCSFQKYIPLPTHTQKGMEFPEGVGVGGGGSVRPKKLKKCMKLIGSRRGVLRKKNLHSRRNGYLWNYQ